MKEQGTELGWSRKGDVMAGAEWFADWLPKHASFPSTAHSEPQPRSNPTEDLPSCTPFDQIQLELKAVTGHLIDPSANGVRASLPHLERAVTGLSAFVKARELSTIAPALESLRAEIAVASMLFENAYTLQAGWAAQAGLNLDGTAKQLLYSRPGEPRAAPARQEIDIENRDAWQG